MTTTPALSGRLDEVLAQYQQARADLQAVQERVRSVTATVKSSKGLVTVTVGPQGDITELTFNTRGYRSMVPAELSTVLIETIAKARAEVAEQMRAAVTPFLPFDLSFDDMRAGKVDWTAMLPERPFDAGTGLAGLATRLRSTSDPD